MDHRIHSTAPVSLVLFLILLLPLTSRAQSNVDSVKKLLVREQDPIKHLKLLRQLSGSDDVDVAMPYAHATIDQADSLLAHDHAGDSTVLSIRASALWDLARTYYSRDSWDSALVWGRQAVAQWRAIGEKERSAHHQTDLAGALISSGKLHEALDLLEVCLPVHEEMNDTNYLGIAHFYMGRASSMLGDDQRALDHYFIALEIAHITGSQEDMAFCLGNIGNLYHDQGQTDTAIVYYQRCISAVEKIPGKRGIEVPVSNLAGILADRGLYDEALQVCNDVLAGFGKDLQRAAVGPLYSTIGMIYRKMGDLDQAAHFGEMAVAIGRRGNKYEYHISELIEFGFTLLAQQHYDEALKQAMTAKALLDSFPMTLNVQKGLAQLFSEIYEKTGPAELALRYYKEYGALKDSVGSEEMRKKLARIDMRKQALSDSLRSEQETHRVALLHQEELNREQTRKRLLMYGGLAVMLLAGGLWSRLRYTRRTKRVLEKEHARSESLLLNILPSEIAEELKSTGGAVARDIDNVSILFTDFKGFTQLSEQLSAQELVGEINTCFKAFDDILGKYGVEKIKTIGDAYMAAGGLPVPSQESARNTVLAALEMQAFMRDYKAGREAQGKPAFEMRVGIHTGPVVAGIVGVKKFQYDIWGDTVNTASRMESAGEVGQVNISAATYELVKEVKEVRDGREVPMFTFIPRGKVLAKGKGELEMYFVQAANE